MMASTKLPSPKAVAKARSLDDLGRGAATQQEKLANSIAERPQEEERATETNAVVVCSEHVGRTIAKDLSAAADPRNSVVSNCSSVDDRLSVKSTPAVLGGGGDHVIRRAPRMSSLPPPPPPPSNFHSDVYDTVFALQSLGDAGWSDYLTKVRGLWDGHCNKRLSLSPANEQTLSNSTPSSSLSSSSTSSSAPAQGQTQGHVNSVDASSSPAQTKTTLPSTGEGHWHGGGQGQGEGSSLGDGQGMGL